MLGLLVSTIFFQQKFETTFFYIVWSICTSSSVPKTSVSCTIPKSLFIYPLDVVVINLVWHFAPSIYLSMTAEDLFQWFQVSAGVARFLQVHSRDTVSIFMKRTIDKLHYAKNCAFSSNSPQEQFFTFTHLTATHHNMFHAQLFMHAKRGWSMFLRGRFSIHLWTFFFTSF